MDDIENLFDINKILSNSYLALKKSDIKQNIDLIFEMDTTIPRELRGNDVVFERLLTTILLFINQNSHSHEILVSLSAPKDFIYEELISLKVDNTGISREKILAFLETGLGNDLNILEGEIIKDKEVDIYLKIPFVIGELGFRRHYRLPSKSMLDKKVLLMLASEKLGQSIGKMIKYFPYDVDIKQMDDDIDLSIYDILVTEENLMNESFCKKIQLIQKIQDLKFVLLGTGEVTIDACKATVATYLVKPVTQYSIFELILTIFDTEKEADKQFPADSIAVEDNGSTVVQAPNIPIESMKKNTISGHSIKEKKERCTLILNTQKGLENAKKMGTTYSDLLKKFLENFEKSDLYFREIVNEKSIHKIKEFCIDLEKEATFIGAEEMLKFTDVISLIVTYNKLDMLPIYPGKYHLELEKLIAEIKSYLHIR